MLIKWGHGANLISIVILIAEKWFVLMPAGAKYVQIVIKMF